MKLRGERALGAQTHLFFRYQLKGADTMQAALVHAKNNVHMSLDVKGLERDRWAETVVDFTKLAQQAGATARHVDEIQFRLPAGAELLIDDLLLYEP